MLSKKSEIIAALIVMLALASMAFAGVPQTINYQGFLKNTTTGAPVSGAVNITFSLYSSATPRNNPVWHEPTKVVTVTNGIYATTIGSATSPVTAPFDVTYYLGINVDGTDLPVQPLTSVPYARRAQVADSVPAGAIANGTITGQMMATGTITSDKLAPGVVQTWQSIATPTTAVANTGYIASGSTPVTVTLPSNAAIGDIVTVSGAGTASWVLQTSGSNVITTSTAGNVAAGSYWTPQPAAGTQYWRAITSSADGKKLAAIVNVGQIYTSTDAGVTWTARGNSRAWNAIASSADGTKLVAAATNELIYTSSDSGVTWTGHDTTRNWYGVASSADGSKLAAVVPTGYIYTSSDSGATWVQRGVTDEWRSIASSADGTKLVAVADGNQVYTSTDSGVTWTRKGIAQGWFFVTSSADGAKLAGVVRGPNSGIYTSVDSGATWTQHETSRTWMAIASSSDGTKLAAVATGGQVYTSGDSGATWTPRDSVRNWYGIASSADGSRLAGVDNSGLVYTSVGGTDVAAGSYWTPQPAAGAKYWRAITSSADGKKLAAVVNVGQIYTSTDAGVTWTARENSRAWNAIASSADGTRLVAVAFNEQIYTSSDSGVTWTGHDIARSWYRVASSADGTKLAAVVAAGYVYTSSDSGATWVQRDPFGNTTDWRSITSSADGTKLVAVNGNAVYTSNDSGVTWAYKGNYQDWICMASSADGTKLAGVARGATSGIYTSADSGATWTGHEASRTWMAIASSTDGTKLAAVADGGQIYTSSDSGATWNPRDSARSWYGIASSADGSRLAAVAFNGSIYTSVAGNIGMLVGNPQDTIQLLYTGNNQYQVVYSIPVQQGLTSIADNSVTVSKLADGAVTNAKISGQISATKLDLSTVVAKGGDTMTGILNLPVNGLIAGTNQLVISGGNVGIGTAAPTQKLDVAGNVKATAFSGNGAGLTNVNAVTVTSGVYTTGSYTDPPWITAISESKLVGILPVGKGGTGAMTQNEAANNILPPQAGNSGKVLGSNGVDTSWVSPVAVTDARFGTGTNWALAGTGRTCTIGEIILSAGAVATGVPANGQILSIMDNTALFSLLGTTYGGDGMTTFALPDLRAVAPNGLTYSICTQGIFPAQN